MPTYKYSKYDSLHDLDRAVNAFRALADMIAALLEDGNDCRSIADGVFTLMDQQCNAVAKLTDTIREEYKA